MAGGRIRRRAGANHAGFRAEAGARAHWCGAESTRRAERERGADNAGSGHDGPVGVVTMAKRDFYETLGVSKTATEAELKSAFRKAAMQCHPDRHPGDKQAEARFKELNEAYQHLSDAQKRAAYDRYGHAAFEHAS